MRANRRECNGCPVHCREFLRRPRKNTAVSRSELDHKRIARVLQVVSYYSFLTFHLPQKPPRFPKKEPMSSGLAKEYSTGNQPFRRFRTRNDNNIGDMARSCTGWSEMVGNGLETKQARQNCSRVVST